jgi:tetratricopeptide (TPR) repeat protein
VTVRLPRHLLVICLCLTLGPLLSWSVCTAQAYKLQPTSDRTVEIDLDVEDGHAPGGDARVAQEGVGAQARLESYRRELAEHRRAGDTTSVVQTLIRLASIYEELNMRVEAVEHYAEVLQLLPPGVEDDKKAGVLYKLGGLSHKLGLYDRAIAYLQQALPLSQKLQHPKYRIFEAMIHRDLGLAYSSAGKGRQAFEQLELSRPLFEEYGEPKETPYVYTLLGLIAPTHKEALDYYSLALTAFRKLNDKRGEAETLGMIARFYGGLNERAALRYYKQALFVWQKVSDLAEQAQTHLQMGWAYAALGDRPKADESYQPALSIIRQLPDNLTAEAEATG